MTACGGETPEQAVAVALDAIKNADIEVASKYIDYGELVQDDDGEMDEDTKEMIPLIFSNTTVGFFWNVRRVDGCEDDGWKIDMDAAADALLGGLISVAESLSGAADEIE